MAAKQLVFNVRGGIIGPEAFDSDSVLRLLAKAVRDAGSDAFIPPKLSWAVLPSRVFQNDPFEGFTTIRVTSGTYKDMEQTRDDESGGSPTPMVSARRMVATTWSWNVCGGSEGDLRGEFRAITRAWRSQGYMKLPTVVSPYASAPRTLAGFPVRGTAQGACGGAIYATTPTRTKAAPMQAGIMEVLKKPAVWGGLFALALTALAGRDR